MLALIGGFFLLLLTDAEAGSRLSSKEMILIMSSWVIFLFIFTKNISPEMFFLFVAIGIVAIKEVTNEFISNEVKKRLNIFLFLFFLIVIVIVVQKIINVVSI